MPVKIDESTVRHMANLSKIDVREEEIPAMVAHFGQVMSYFSVLEELVGTDDPFGLYRQAAAPLRDDAAASWSGREDAMSQAPVRDGDFFRVPKIGEEGQE